VTPPVDADGETLAGPAGSGWSGRVRLVLRAVAVAAAATVVVAGFLPWTISGSVVRDSFATARSARLLDAGDHPVTGAAQAAWHLVPAVAVAAALAAVLGRDRGVGALTAVVGATAVAGGFAVVRSPVAIGAGVPLAIGAGTTALVSGIGLAVGGRRPRRAP